jgi:toxin YhaV
MAGSRAWDCRIAIACSSPPFEAEGLRLLLILWLGFPRKDGDRNDCYAVFSRLVQRGELPEDWESLQRELDAG